MSTAPVDKPLPAARIKLGSPEHMFRIGGKVVQMSELHQCNDHEVNIANFLKFKVENRSTS